LEEGLGAFEVSIAQPYPGNFGKLGDSPRVSLRNSASPSNLIVMAGMARAVFSAVPHGLTQRGVDQQDVFRGDETAKSTWRW
jgi:hypothetical protein